jgi:hypothetical protein
MCKNTLTIACWFCLYSWCFGADPEMSELLRGLKEKDPQTQNAVVNTLQRQRKELILGLLAIVDNRDLQRSNPYGVVKAIDLLGEYRASEAVSSLTTLLLFERVTQSGMPIEVGRGGGGLRVEPTPAVRALIRIGRASVPLMLEKIQQDNGEAVLSRALTVMMGVEGDEGVIFLLRKAHTECKTPQGKSNIESAMDYYEKNKKSISATAKQNFPD